MSAPRVQEIQIEGMRTLADVRLQFDGLTVLIGENGTGKSSIIEACELLRRVASFDFMSEFYNPHGGMFALLRDGAQRLRVRVRISAQIGDKPEAPMDYILSLTPAGVGATIEEERLWIHYAGHAEPFKVIDRGLNVARVWNGQHLESVVIQPAQSLLSSVAPVSYRHPAVDLVRETLQSFEAHLAFESLPVWAAKAFSRKSEIRSSVLLQPVDRVDLLGTNLANAFYALRERSSRAYWDETMDLVRLGFGMEFEEVRSAADLGGGSHALAVKWRGRERLMPAAALSEGQIAYLGFVALYRLERRCALLAFDEPELHLHPGLVIRVVQMFEAMAETHPVILATHSDRLLDALAEPARSVQVCELERGETRLRRLDAEQLAEWLVDFQGLGAVRSEGHLEMVLAEVP